MKRLSVLGVFLIFFAYTFGQTGIPKAQSMFIYNFSRLVEWPAGQKSGDFVIGVVGNSNVYSEIQTFTAGKKVGNQSITVKQFNDFEDVTPSHILFVSYSKSSKLEDALSGISNGTLIITEKRNMLADGAVINFLIESDKLKFELDDANAQKMGLKVSSSLQNMAVK
ncbi:MAG: YfiR family protein [Bacteroidota bacterium]